MRHSQLLFGDPSRSVVRIIIDANLFHHLETWTPDPAHQYITLYLSQIQAFQKHLTTEAFKIAGGVDMASSSNSSASKPVRQHRIATSFISKIAKSFLDALYAFLDGMVRLASDEVEIPKQKPVSGSDGGVRIATGSKAELVDLSDPVCNILLFYPETKFLLVIPAWLGFSSVACRLKFWAP